MKKILFTILILLFWVTPLYADTVFVEPNQDAAGGTNWNTTDGGGVFYTEVDEGATPDTNDYIYPTASEDDTLDLGFQTPNIGHRGSVTSIKIKIYGEPRDMVINKNLYVDISTDGGSNWEGEKTFYYDTEEWIEDDWTVAVTDLTDLQVRMHIATMEMGSVSIFTIRAQATYEEAGIVTMN